MDVNGCFIVTLELKPDPVLRKSSPCLDKKVQAVAVKLGNKVNSSFIPMSPWPHFSVLSFLSLMFDP